MLISRNNVKLCGPALGNAASYVAAQKLLASSPSEEPTSKTRGRMHEAG
jgi:hypothetical protein